MTDLQFREQFTDAVAAVVNDQERAGLDIVTNGDYHLDADHAGRSWFIYPTERLDGMSEHSLSYTNPMWSYPVGTWLNEIVGGWKFPLVTGKVGPRIPLRVRQDLARRPGARRPARSSSGRSPPTSLPPSSRSAPTTTTTTRSS